MYLRPCPVGQLKSTLGVLRILTAFRVQAAFSAGMTGRRAAAAPVRWPPWHSSHYCSLHSLPSYPIHRTAPNPRGWKLRLLVTVRFSRSRTAEVAVFSDTARSPSRRTVWALRLPWSCSAHLFKAREYHHLTLGHPVRARERLRKEKRLGSMQDARALLLKLFLKKENVSRKKWSG